MTPGVTYLPVPSTITASAGATRLVPTPAILPSRRSTDALVSVGPAAVITVALRMNVVRDGNGWYVLGNGLAFGSDSAPGPDDGFDVLPGVGCVGAGALWACGAHAASPSST